ncbi:acetyl-CoA carboxylase biotin carboxylase subunit [Anaeropeptidivorans aminofermentans]|uniref:acetyl-CoA carboxylase biotin carboxylase subunit n=1 Tax=Anaeropeptidivorans aminofermentans TaxID=2934315 RepID=UPI00202442DF|nr:acetyl-CoA carboxylase biotin carboxylase subunit [Anaeropeptidivorans aminofermentans]
MFNKILIANRGEIAVRIIRACREMGISTVAVFSEADRDALHTQMADEAVCIGPAKSSESYLNMHNILSAACKLNVQAIHPGFGFLAENSVFASMCGECNIKFIGPEPSAIDLLGNKAKARELMADAGIPVIPGSKGAIKSLDEAYAFAEESSYPVMLKASAGGGGKGIRVVESKSKMENAYLSAKNEAMANFSDDGIYIEKMIINPRHIEVQLLCDEHGNYLYLGERDCSLQRRNQKLLEEAPALGISEETRKQMGEAAILGAKAAGYTNAGTIEFLYDKDGKFYFMEMNTRIQVEHPITEMITGIDIVKEQIRIAAGEKLSISQKDIEIRGHSIECRINAENPEKGFIPSPGKISYVLFPSGCLGLRVDSGVYPGCEIPPFYDSMIAKVITHGTTRQDAIEKMKRALSEFVINGVYTNIEFQLGLLTDENFIEGKFDTGFIERKLSSGN